MIHALKWDQFKSLIKFIFGIKQPLLKQQLFTHSKLIMHSGFASSQLDHSISAPLRHSSMPIPHVPPPAAQAPQVAYQPVRTMSTTVTPVMPEHASKESQGPTSLYQPPWNPPQGQMQAPQAVAVEALYPWVEGAHYTVGVQVSIPTVFYAQKAGNKVENQPVAIQEPQPVSFEQATINFEKQNHAIKVANKGCHCLDCWVFLLILFITTLILLILTFVIHPGIVVLLIGVQVLRFSMICCTDTRKFLQKLNLSINPYDHTAAIQRTDPYSVWHINCYHYEDRTRIVTYKDFNGNTQTRIEHYTVRVDTHSNTVFVSYPGTQDASPILSGLENYRMTRIYNTFSLAFGSRDALIDYYQERKLWILRNDRDVHYDFSEKDLLPGLRPHMLTYNGDRKKFPKLLNCCCFLLLAFVMFDWLMVFWFMRNSARLDYRFQKIATRVQVGRY